VCDLATPKRGRVIPSWAAEPEREREREREEETDFVTSVKLDGT